MNIVTDMSNKLRRQKVLVKALKDALAATDAGSRSHYTVAAALAAEQRYLTLLGELTLGLQNSPKFAKKAARELVPA